MKNKIEVIAWSVEDAIRIEQAGADRIELVVELERGGLTPPIELVKEVCEAVSIPVRVMVRDTDESFNYNESIMKSHLNYIEQLKETKAEGIVFGSLTKDHRLNIKQLEEVIKIKDNLKLSYHRAFDTLGTEEIAYQEFIKLAQYDVDTQLTSGLAKKAIDGTKFIKRLVESGTKINILAGSGVNLDNYEKIVLETGVSYIHVGTAVRDEVNKIDIKKIKQMKEGIN